MGLNGVAADSRPALARALARSLGSPERPTVGRASVCAGIARTRMLSHHFGATGSPVAVLRQH